MTTFKISFEIDNAAFAEGFRNQEINRILDKIKTQLDHSNTRPISDFNGNNVGFWNITD